MVFDRLKTFSFLHLLKATLDTRAASIGSFLVAVLAKSLVSWIYLDLETDKSVFLLFAKNFLDAGIFAEPIRSAANGDFFYIYNPAIASPLYSLLAVPLLAIIKSFTATDFVISVFGWCFLFLALYKLARLLFVHRWLANLFLLIVAFYLYPHEMESPPKDTLAAAATLWTIVLMHDFLNKPVNLRRTALLALTVASIFLVKLTYVPAAAVSALLLLVFIILKKSKGHALHFLWFSLFLIAIGVAVYAAIYLPAHRLSNPLMDKLGRDGVPLLRGFYPENLRYAFPFISSSLININFWGVQIEQKAGVSFVNAMNVFKLVDVISALMLAFYLFMFYRRIFRSRLSILLTAIPLALVASLFCMSTIFALTRPDRYSSNLWTYVTEARFYFVPMLVLQLALFRTIFLTNKRKTIRMIAFLLLLFEAAHGLYFDAKQTANMTAVKSELQNKSAVKKVTAEALQVSQKYTDFGLITTDNSLRRFAELNGILTYSLSGAAVNMSWAKSGTLFLLATHPQDSSLQKISGMRLVKTDTLQSFLLQYCERN